MAVLVIAPALATSPAVATSGPQPFVDGVVGPVETDAVAPVFDTEARNSESTDPFAAPVIDEFSGDPLRLVVWPNDVRRYSESSDRFGVYVCTWEDATGNVELAAATATLNSQVTTFYEGLSGGLYSPEFVARKVVTASGFSTCADAMAAEANLLWGDNGAIGILDNQSNAGLAGPGLYCNNCENLSVETFPGNQRWAVIEGGSVKPVGLRLAHITTAAHEVGHTISFPHSYSGETVDEYDNPIDYMSGNMPGNFLGRGDDPYSSLAFNRYRAGWIDPADVVFYAGGITELTIAPVGVDGTQLVILPTDYEYSFVALDARVNSALDPIPSNFEGVSAHYIEQWCKNSPTAPATPCGGLSSRPYSYPPSPNSIDHVTGVGGTARFNIDQGEPLIAQGALLKVIDQTEAGIVIQLIGFDDVLTSVFIEDILWLADSGITAGCSETSYCPTANVTRGQMAAFLTRALGYTDRGEGNLFIDDDDSIFEPAIDALATAKVTTGCNPPVSDRFCPDSFVTREQMAAFLVRALDLTDTGGGNEFTDDNDSIFEEDIAKLAAAGITAGCNPPDNTQFCPTDRVTREQMAAFLRRALSS
jgi:hypothetical protein